jgi:hypothetical protein
VKKGFNKSIPFVLDYSKKITDMLTATLAGRRSLQLLKLVLHKRLSDSISYLALWLIKLN